jgi:hypothetical protein
MVLTESIVIPIILLEFVLYALLISYASGFLYELFSGNEEGYKGYEDSKCRPHALQSKVDSDISA